MTLEVGTAVWIPKQGRVSRVARFAAHPRFTGNLAYLYFYTRENCGVERAVTAVILLFSCVRKFFFAV